MVSQVISTSINEIGLAAKQVQCVASPEGQPDIDFVSINRPLEEYYEPSKIYYGSFYCAYKEDGFAFVWIPRWIRTTVLPDDEKIKMIIVSSLEEAPLQERVFVAKARAQWCQNFNGYPDDHDLSCVSYHVTSEAVSSGCEAYNQAGVLEAFHNTTKKLINFIDGELND